MATRLTDPFTGKKYPSYPALLAGILRDGESQLERSGVTAAQVVFNRKNGLPLLQSKGRSVLSGKPTDWNERSCRYERFHDDVERAAYRQIFLDRMRRVHGREHLLDDPEHQKYMLASRKISGTYTFQDGSQKTYVGEYERRLLEFFDLGLNWPSVDLQTPAPQVFVYRGPDGNLHNYYPDLYCESLNLIIEIKGSMENPNAWRNRDIEIEHAKDETLGTSGYNYLKLVGTDFGILVDEIARLKSEWQR